MAKAQLKLVETQPQAKPKRERVILSAADWHRILKKREKDQRDFDEKRTLEMSVEDLRDDAIAIIRNELGRGEQAFDMVHARMGPHPSTLKHWEDKKIRSSEQRSTPLAMS
jgi:DNA-binding transcriptional regulator YiaG